VACGGEGRRSAHKGGFEATFPPGSQSKEHLAPFRNRNVLNEAGLTVMHAFLTCTTSATKLSDYVVKTKKDNCMVRVKLCKKKEQDWLLLCVKKRCSFEQSTNYGTFRVGNGGHNSGPANR
jgi:hypothetical protein